MEFFVDPNRYLPLKFLLKQATLWRRRAFARLPLPAAMPGEFWELLQQVPIYLMEMILSGHIPQRQRAFLFLFFGRKPNLMQGVAGRQSRSIKHTFAQQFTRDFSTSKLRYMVFEYFLQLSSNNICHNINRLIFIFLREENGTAAGFPFFERRN